MIPALVRDQFPALAADPGIVYLDSAVTAQKPRRVIEAATAALAVQASSHRDAADVAGLPYALAATVRSPRAIRNHSGHSITLLSLYDDDVCYA